MNSTKVKKIELEAVIYTSILKIEGFIHVMPGERVSDFMTSTKGPKFIPITNAKVTEIGNSCILQKSEFLSLNADEIVCLLPKSSLQKMDYQKEFYSSE